MGILICDSTALSSQPYLDELRKYFPDRPMEIWTEGCRLAPQADYALVFKPPRDLFAAAPNLKAVFNLGAGVDALMVPGVVPDHLPITRIKDPMLNQCMTEYVTYGVLHFHRNMSAFWEAQKKADWIKTMATDPRQTRVGILGLGALGSACAHALKPFQFPVMGWSRSLKNIAGVQSFCGPDGLKDMLAQTDILVCLLPLTAETENILNRDLFDQLPRGAKLIHAGRGGQLQVDDFKAAIASGQLGGALLDVFPTEPLTRDDPLWGLENVLITPHVASQTLASTAIAGIVENIKRFEAGEEMIGLVDRQKGY